MKAQFFELAERLCGKLRADETLLCNLSAERSDFVRFNKSLVRQAGTVSQSYMTVRLLHARRQASATIALGGDSDDYEHATNALGRVRDMLSQLPEDPWLLISTEVHSTESAQRGQLIAPEAVVEQVTGAAREVDLVGFYAGGTICRGFANSLGQRNWHEVDSFNFDWSLYLRADKAVKDGYAGLDWDSGSFAHRLAGTTTRLELLKTEPRTPAPGEYRVYLAPRALEEITGLLCWGGFSAKARATRQSPLLRMEHGETLSSKVTLTEHTAGSIAPQFQQDGYVRPQRVELIRQGALGDALISPRSAMEYGLQTNAAGAYERPEALELAGGSLDEEDALRALDTGIYVGNLWYLNYSDRPAGRITGMTRFATFWVEGGRIVAPINAMRFDDTIYRMLGPSLIDFTAAPELLLDPSTYGERSTASTRLPGALLRTLRFTL
jgi:predicted Zn-dependent protease